MKHPMERERSGFTLVEMLVTITIIVLLSGILLPMLSGARKRARRAACAANLSQIGKAAQMYLNNYSNRLPNIWYEILAAQQGLMSEGSGMWWVQLNEQGIDDTRVFACPSLPGIGEPEADVDGDDIPDNTLNGHGFNADNIDYGYNDCWLRDEDTRNTAATPADPDGDYIKFRGFNLYRANRPAQIIMVADSTADADQQSVIRQVNAASDSNRSSRNLGEDDNPASEDDDRVYGRHVDTANVLYLDSHVAASDPDQIHLQGDGSDDNYGAYPPYPPAVAPRPAYDANYDFRPWSPMLR